MKRKLTEGNTIQQVKQMRAIAHQQPTIAQPVPEWYFPPKTFLVLLLSVMLYGVEYPFGQLFWQCPLLASCTPPATPAHQERPVDCDSAL